MFHRVVPRWLNVYLVWNMGLMLRKGPIVDATIIHAPQFEPRMQTESVIPRCSGPKKATSYYFRHEGAHRWDCCIQRLVHSLVGHTANAADVTQVDKLLHGGRKFMCAVIAGYTGVQGNGTSIRNASRVWSIAVRPGSSNVEAKPS